ncbi:hypothetical protein HOLleu_19481 [Holothuria leucospilota]|uniref:DDE Tnp4 domain-containing protein n=1 Tax=Holothuria leucospilota TaxID=206669 RepID=A0A9Q1BYG0_HOLLE|nr:hypothetical protein HOLleu_19481 [Holothuria leucospilota]
MRMPPAMFDELVERLTPRLTRSTTNYRANLEPGLKVAVTLRHLASGAKYRDMRYAWRDHTTPSAKLFESELRRGLENDNISGWPHPDPLPNDTQDVPYFIVGDDAFALRTFLMKPYSARNLTREERIFNYRLSRARRVVENAFGILANRFQVLLTTMQHHAETVRLIVKACILLHNVMHSRYPVLQNRLPFKTLVQFTCWFCCLARQDSGLLVYKALEWWTMYNLYDTFY